MPSRRIPSLRKHKASGQSVVTLGGRDHYCGPWGSRVAVAEYDRLVGEWLASGRPSHAPRRESVSIAELLLAYAKHCQDYYRPPSREWENIKYALRPLKERYAHVPATEFGPLALRSLREVWVEAGLARRNVNKRTGMVVRMFRWAVENELVDATVWHSLQAVEGLRAGRSAAKETAPVSPVADADFEATVAAIASPQVRAMLRLIRLTGARPGEICAMRHGDVDQSCSPWVYKPRSHKTAFRGHERVIYIGPKAQQVLEPWLKATPDAFVFSPAEAAQAVHDQAKVDHRDDGDRERALRNKRAARARDRGGKAKSGRRPGLFYTAARLGHAVGRACVRVGIAHWHPHQLRHAAATELRREIGFEAARVVLGHRSPGVTERYAEADRSAAAAAMGRVG